MTRTQLKAMSNRELVEHARGVAETFVASRIGLVIEELANRLDDQYPFTLTDFAEIGKAAAEVHNPILDELTWKES